MQTTDSVNCLFEWQEKCEQWRFFGKCLVPILQFLLNNKENLNLICQEERVYLPSHVQLICRYDKNIIFTVLKNQYPNLEMQVQWSCTITIHVHKVKHTGKNVGIPQSSSFLLIKVALKFSQFKLFKCKAKNSVIIWLFMFSMFLYTHLLHYKAPMKSLLYYTKQCTLLLSLVMNHQVLIFF